MCPFVLCTYLEVEMAGRMETVEMKLNLNKLLHCYMLKKSFVLALREWLRNSVVVVCKNALWPLKVFKGLK